MLSQKARGGSVVCRVFSRGVRRTKSCLTSAARHLSSKSDIESFFQALLRDLSQVKSTINDFSRLTSSECQCPTLSQTRRTLGVQTAF